MALVCCSSQSFKFFMNSVLMYFQNILVSFIQFLFPENISQQLCLYLKTVPRDIRFIYHLVHAILELVYDKLTKQTVVSKFQKYVKLYPNKASIIFGDQSWTFKQVDDYSDQVARFFHSAGYKPGDVIALFMTNRVEYAPIWLGLAKIGVTTALINTNLRKGPLIHCLSVVNCKSIIFSSDLISGTLQIQDTLLSLNLEYYQSGEGDVKSGFKNFDELLTQQEPIDLPPIKILPSDHLLYIYTSGTTGLPKAAVMPHTRLLLLGVLLRNIAGFTSDEIVYSPLPLYHTAGGIVGVGSSFLIGTTAVTRKKFSASSYMTDCIKHKCTVGQYIGEVGRYLLASPPSLQDKQHSLKLLFGNGISATVWTGLVQRFGIPRLIEVYGATEGNVYLINTENRIGAVGLVPKILPFSKYLYGVIVKINWETSEPLRDQNGLCIPCGVNEPGMLVGPIAKIMPFHGYLDKKETSKKLLRNVLKKGDLAFVTGDVMYKDEEGFVFFKDRTGDTFRWKGENVATSEIENVLRKIVGPSHECAVYGVKVGELEGRAGMAAVTGSEDEFNFPQIVESLNSTLPVYAQPLFIRFVKELEFTGTFKVKKFNLQNEGFDLAQVTDPIYFRMGNTYVKLTHDIVQKIISHEIRV